MKISIQFLCIVCVLLTGCVNRSQQLTRKNDSSDSNKIYFLDFERYLRDASETFTINSIAKKISFIPLETSDKAMLTTENFKVVKINEHYYISSSLSPAASNIMMFDSTGCFTDYLIQAGRGPKELAYILGWSLNQNLQQFVVFGIGEVLLHSVVENITSKYGLAESLYMTQVLNDGNIVGIPGLYKEKTDTPYLKFLNHKGEIVKSLFYSAEHNVTYHVPENTGNIGPLENYGLYSNYFGNALFKDMFNDTIFCIRSLNKIEPYIIMNRGSFAPKVKDALDKAAKAKTIMIRGVLETGKYFFITYAYKDIMFCAVWDKETVALIDNVKAENIDEHQVIISNRNSNGFTKYQTPNGKEILVAISSYADNKLYCFIDASDAMKFLPDIKEDDNPIVMVIEMN